MLPRGSWCLGWRCLVDPLTHCHSKQNSRLDVALARERNRDNRKAVFQCRLRLLCRAVLPPIAWNANARRTRPQKKMMSTGHDPDREKSSSSVAEFFWHLRSRRSEEHTSELQSRQYLVCRLLLEKKHDATHRPPLRLAALVYPLQLDRAASVEAQFHSGQLVRLRNTAALPLSDLLSSTAPGCASRATRTDSNRCGPA